MSRSPNGHADATARILVIDDNPDIAAALSRVFDSASSQDDELRRLEDSLFGPEPADQPDDKLTFTVDAADGGEVGCEMARRARLEGRPYALAFVDMRMPGGWDGLKTVEELWRRDDRVQVVICTAFCDYEWSEIVERLGRVEQLLILRKPFDPGEAREIARSLHAKWLHSTTAPAMERSARS